MLFKSPPNHQLSLTNHYEHTRLHPDGYQSEYHTNELAIGKDGITADFSKQSRLIGLNYIERKLFH